MGGIWDWVRGRPARTGIWVLWAVFFAVYMLFFYTHGGASEIADAELDGYLEIILLALPLVILFGGAMWMSETDVDRGLQLRVVVWAVASGVLFLLAIHTSLFILEPTYDRGERLLLLQFAAGFGTSMGTITGIVEARSVQRGRGRERAAVIARRRRREKQRLEYLNQYLRHEVLNEINKINGYAGLLQQRDDLSGEADEWVRIIKQGSEEVGQVVSSIRSMMNADDGDPEVGPVDVSATVEATAERLRRTHPAARVTVDTPGSVYATAGSQIDRVFTNLIENAVSHGSDDPMVRVTVEEMPERVVIRVADDGPGVPSDEREGLFEPPESGDHGYGLFLNRTLVELYGGRLDLAHTGPEGSVFEVRLEPATLTGEPSSGRSDAPEQEAA